MSETIGPDADIAAKLVALASLHDAGSLSDNEFADAKDQLLHGHRSPTVAESTPKPYPWPLASALVFTIAAVVVIFAGAYLGAWLFDPLIGAVVALAVDIAFLTFLTLRAYPPAAKIPWLRLGFGAFLVTPIPIAYLSWLWFTRRNWTGWRCDTCGAEVAADAKVCPSCAVTFAD